ncbi:hypothetical protein JCM10450v2_005745 [Rhodotorula kratochvilovae]
MPRRPRSLLDLPDELLTPILRIAFELEHSEERKGTAVPLARIAVNKRVWAIGLPLWLERIRFPALDNRFVSSGDTFFGGLVGHSSLWSHVRSAEIHTVNSYPSLAVGTLSSFASLTSLTIFETSLIPQRLTQALGKLKELRSLSIIGSACLEDVNFDLRKTSIRQLAGSHCAALQQLLQGGKGAALEELELRVSNLSYYTSIPWGSLSALRLTGDPDGTCVYSGIDQFIQSYPADAVQTTSTYPPPLVQFELAVGDTTSTTADRRTARYELLTYFGRAAAPSFVKLSQLSFIDASSMKKDFSSVETLELEGSAQMASGDNLDGLRHLLTLFPSLSSLTLTAFPFHEKSTSLVSDFDSQPFATFGMRYPAFAALFTFLRKTSVLAWRYQPASEPLELRCTRRSRSQTFNHEVVRLLRR